MASFKKVNGIILAIGCKKAGKISIGKKEPLNINWGKVIKLAIDGKAFSSLARVDTNKPNPKKISNPYVVRISIVRIVHKPFTSVKLKTKCPINIITIACNRAIAKVLSTWEAKILNFEAGVANI